jgi:hypothetical protein
VEKVMAMRVNQSHGFTTAEIDNREHRFLTILGAGYKILIVA